MKQSGIILSILFMLIALLTLIMGDVIPAQFQIIGAFWFAVPFIFGLLALYSLLS